ncbi:type II toxin-antitoxin system death-on-curing family toxin [Mycoplasmopsis pulmonis]|uniref:type II toxin-antitoxin system death-on-curing family toxin n=1 Tax=Mycoplasmopsis pulmonis TaxID=2107 RepID=UPI001004F049|nr:type II toxin-antitoxin system death-on-curing family toxin [Mycoplasmopsis pulmonis]VEU68155.1 death-on-curing family protein [Mycoplasmopsis pulmonis]
MYKSIRKIKFFVSSFEIDKGNKYLKQYIEKYKSSMIKTNIDGKYYFDSYFNDKKEEVEFIIGQIEINDIFYKKLEKIIEYSTKHAKKINVNTKSKDDFKLKEDNHSVFDKLWNIAFKYERKEESWNFFEFTADLFIKLLTSHVFYNGNKRFSISFLITFLEFNGYYFKWSHESEYQDFSKQTKLLESDIACFTTRLSNRDLSDYVESESINDKNTILYSLENECKDKIKSQDLNLSVDERKEKVNNEIIEWIKKNVLISYKIKI